MPKLIISKTLNFVLVFLNVFGRVKSNGPFTNFAQYFCYYTPLGGSFVTPILRGNFLKNGTRKNAEEEKILFSCSIVFGDDGYVYFQKNDDTGEELILLYKKLKFPQSGAADITLQDIENGETNVLRVTEARIVTPSDKISRVFFKESIAYDQRADKDGTQTQYILISEKSEQKVKKLTLIPKAPNLPVKIDMIVVFKIDHSDESRIIVFSAATLEDTQINYATAREVAYNEHRLKSKSGSRHSTAIKEAISREITELGFQCLEYDDDVMTESKDRCPTNPQTNHSIKINYRSAERTVTVYSSTFNTSVCYELDWEEFEWKTLWTILIVVIAIVVFVILVVVCWRKKKCCFQESNTAPPSPQGENPMSVARFQNHQSNDRHNGANRPAVEVQADQEDIVLSRVSVGPIDEDEYARENEVQPDHVDEEYVSDSESQKNDGSESQKNDV